MKKSSLFLSSALVALVACSSDPGAPPPATENGAPTPSGATTPGAPNPGKIDPKADLTQPSQGITCDGTGNFCGGHGARGGDAATLYACKKAGVAPAATTACLNGCEAGATPGADACKVAPPSADNAVVCPGKGLYCGSDGVQNSKPDTLYDCVGKGLSASSAQACALGCKVMPQGTNDRCNAPGPTCPGPGAYCGSDGVTGGDVSTLYHCPGAGKAPTSSEACAHGCDTKPAGTNDVCKSNLSCPGGGDYCGSDGISGGDPNTLYHCAGGGQAPTSSRACSGGCSVQPAGKNDFCGATQPCPSGGDFCGNDGIGGPAGVLFHCAGAGQMATVKEVCSGGCTVQPAGTNDVCAGGGGCTAQGAAALGWEASQLNGGNSWSEYCLGFVNNAYAYAGNSPGYLHVSDADTSLQGARSTGRFTDWNGTCPCGAIIYWAANACNAYWGHVAICNGDGTASTSGWPGFAGSTNASISWLDSSECGHTPAGYILP